MASHWEPASLAALLDEDDPVRSPLLAELTQNLDFTRSFQAELRGYHRQLAAQAAEFASPDPTNAAAVTTGAVGASAPLASNAASSAGTATGAGAGAGTDEASSAGAAHLAQLQAARAAASAAAALGSVAKASEFKNDRARTLAGVMRPPHAFSALSQGAAASAAGSWFPTDAAAQQLRLVQTPANTLAAHAVTIARFMLSHMLALVLLKARLCRRWSLLRQAVARGDIVLAETIAAALPRYTSHTTPSGLAHSAASSATKPGFTVAAATASAYGPAVPPPHAASHRPPAATASASVPAAYVSSALPRNSTSASGRPRGHAAPSLDRLMRRFALTVRAVERDYLDVRERVARLFPRGIPAELIGVAPSQPASTSGGRPISTVGAGASTGPSGSAGAGSGSSSRLASARSGDLSLGDITVGLCAMFTAPHETSALQEDVLGPYRDRYSAPEPVLREGGPAAGSAGDDDTEGDFGCGSGSGGDGLGDAGSDSDADDDAPARVRPDSGDETSATDAGARRKPGGGRRGSVAGSAAAAAAGSILFARASKQQNARSNNNSTGDEHKGDARPQQGPAAPTMVRAPTAAAAGGAKRAGDLSLQFMPSDITLFLRWWIPELNATLPTRTLLQRLRAVPLLLGDRIWGYAEALRRGAGAPGATIPGVFFAASRALSGGDALSTGTGGGSPAAIVHALAQSNAAPRWQSWWQWLGLIAPPATPRGLHAHAAAAGTASHTGSAVVAVPAPVSQHAPSAFPLPQPAATGARGAAHAHGQWVTRTHAFLLALESLAPALSGGALRAVTDAAWPPLGDTAAALGLGAPIVAVTAARPEPDALFLPPLPPHVPLADAEYLHLLRLLSLPLRIGTGCAAPLSASAPLLPLSAAEHLRALCRLRGVRVPTAVRYEQGHPLARHVALRFTAAFRAQGTLLVDTGLVAAAEAAAAIAGAAGVVADAATADASSSSATAASTEGATSSPLAVRRAVLRPSLWVPYVRFPAPRQPPRVAAAWAAVAATPLDPLLRAEWALLSAPDAATVTARVAAAAGGYVATAAAHATASAEMYLRAAAGE